MSKPIPVLIGIDIGIKKNTGMAIYFPKKKKYHSIFSTNIFAGLAICKEWANNEDYAVIFVVENSDLDSNVYGAGADLLSYIMKNRASISKGAWKKNLTRKIGQVLAWASNVGKNKGLAVSFIAQLEDLGYTVAQVSPSKRRKAGNVIKIGKTKTREKVSTLPMPTKTTTPEFKELTGYEEKTNEHGRDAATLVWKKTWMFWANWARTQNVTKTKKSKLK